MCVPETPVVQDRDGIGKSCHIGRILLVPAPRHPGREKEVRLSSCEGPPRFPQGQTGDEVHTAKVGIISEEPSRSTDCSLREGRGSSHGSNAKQHCPETGEMALGVLEHRRKSQREAAERKQTI